MNMSFCRIYWPYGGRKDGYMNKEYDELCFTDDFLFCKILTEDLELCKNLLELILGIGIRKVKCAVGQKTIRNAYKSKGVRFDVYVEDDEDSAFDIEMQVKDRADLPKRSRYYQGMMDLNLIRRGAPYKALKKGIVIFFCLFDHFGADLPVYTFENYCAQEKSIRLGDETQKVFVNTSCTSPDIPKNIKNLFEYIRTRKTSDELTRTIEQRVGEAIDQEKWRDEYMTLKNKLDEVREDALLEGETRGETKILVSLVSAGKLDIITAAEMLGISPEEFDAVMASQITSA